DRLRRHEPTRESWGWSVDLDLVVGTWKGRIDAVQVLRAVDGDPAVADLNRGASTRRRLREEEGFSHRVGRHREELPPIAGRRAARQVANVDLPIARPGELVEGVRPRTEPVD